MKIEGPDMEKTPTWVVLVIVVIMTGCLVYAAKKNEVIPVGPQRPSPSATR